MTQQTLIGATGIGLDRNMADIAAPPRAPLAMPKQVLTPEMGLMRLFLGLMFAFPARLRPR